MVQDVAGQVSEFYELDYVSGVSYVFSIRWLAWGFDGVF